MLDVPPLAELLPLLDVLPRAVVPPLLDVPLFAELLPLLDVSPLAVAFPPVTVARTVVAPPLTKRDWLAPPVVAPPVETTALPGAVAPDPPDWLSVSLKALEVPPMVTGNESEEPPLQPAAKHDAVSATATSS